QAPTSSLPCTVLSVRKTETSSAPGPRPASPTKNSPICSQRWPSLKAGLRFLRSPPATSIWPPSPVRCTTEASLASISSSLSQRTRLRLNPIKTMNMISCQTEAPPSGPCFVLIANRSTPSHQSGLPREFQQLSVLT
uniref:Uncharacterized protein n=1 Tax=Mustela putorius furo TaxID=9669 RepID=M3YTR9_MUSPF